MLAGEVVAVEVNEARARRAGGERAAARRSERRASSTPTAVICRRSLTGFDRALVDAPCSGLGVLAPRPDLRWRSRPLPGLQFELLLAAAERVRPGGTIVYSVCTINREEAEDVVDASGLASGPDARRRMAGVPPRAAARVPPDAAARPRDERLLRRQAACPARSLRSPSGMERLDPRRGGGRAVALRGRFLAPRRADSGAARGGRACLPFRRRRRPLRPAGDDRPGRAALDRPARARGGWHARLPPDGDRPGAPLRGDRRVGRRLA